MPYIYSWIYRWLGVTSKAGFVTALFIILTGAGLYALLPWLAERLGLGRTAGFLGGLVGALTLGWYGHGEYLAGIGLALILITFTRRWVGEKTIWPSSLLLGLGIGFTLHIQPAVLTVILGCLAYEIGWVKKPKKMLHLRLVVLGIILISIPWTWRNLRDLDSLIFVRGNLGLELRLGNHEGVVPTMEVLETIEEHRHPVVHFGEAKLVRELGEAAYMRGALDEALEWIRENPWEFTQLTALRAANLWFGPLHRPAGMIGVSALSLLAALGAWLSFRGLTPAQRMALFLPLLAFPVTYYFFVYMPRYRAPIDWILFLLAGSVFSGWLKRDNIGERE